MYLRLVVVDEECGGVSCGIGVGGVVLGTQ
jgi:hypothetical protein